MRITGYIVSLVAIVGTVAPASAELRPAANPYGVLITPRAFARDMAAPAANVASPPAPIADTPAPSANSDRARRMLAYRAIARSEAKETEMPYDLVDAVMKIESDYSPDRIGDVGEIGLMQIRPGTAAMLGYRGLPGQLADPAVNIHYGTLYLSQAWRLAKGDVCRTLMKYRAGHGQDAMSALSSSYCARAQAHLLAMASPLAATIKPGDFVVTLGPDVPVAGAKRARSGRTFWTAFEARIKKINARIEAKWRRVASR